LGSRRGRNSRWAVRPTRGPNGSGQRGRRVRNRHALHLDAGREHHAHRGHRCRRGRVIRPQRERCRTDELVRLCRHLALVLLGVDRDVVVTPRILQVDAGDRAILDPGLTLVRGTGSAFFASRTLPAVHPAPAKRGKRAPAGPPASSSAANDWVNRGRRRRRGLASPMSPHRPRGSGSCFRRPPAQSRSGPPAPHRSRRGSWFV
jgi:hypothetical protein